MKKTNAARRVAPTHVARPVRQSRRHKVPPNNPDLDPFFVWWDVVTKRDVARVRKAVRTASNERAMQVFFEENPEFLIQHLGGGHGRWVLPHRRLGAEYCTDFLIADRCSVGYSWQAVELESPRARMFTKSGDPSAALTHAMRQILDWRNWLEANGGYARRSRRDAGLGLPEIDTRSPGLILMSTRAQESEANAQRRKRLSLETNIWIHTYDFVVEACAGRAAALEHATPPQKASRWTSILPSSLFDESK